MRKLWIIAGVLLALALAAGSAAAGKTRSDTPRYDTNHEYTIHGTVVETRTHMSVQGYEDEHVMIDSGHGVFEVHLAPVAFLDQHGMKLAKGDAVVITGSLTHWSGADVVVAREITKEGKALEVRDAGGAALWRRARA